MSANQYSAMRGVISGATVWTVHRLEEWSFDGPWMRGDVSGRDLCAGICLRYVDAARMKRLSRSNDRESSRCEIYCCMEVGKDEENWRKCTAEWSAG